MRSGTGCARRPALPSSKRALADPAWRYTGAQTADWRARGTETALVAKVPNMRVIHIMLNHGEVRRRAAGVAFSRPLGTQLNFLMSRNQPF